MSTKNSVQELSEDIEVVGPGQMLAQARESIGLSQQQVADQLNFRTTLVKDIENEVFDQEIPATFNRGYLRNYAKLVGISTDDVLASYETLNIAQKQCAELQSFSKGTEKQAENNRIMWISYLILALLIASSIVWWLQEARNNTAAVTFPLESSSVISQTENAESPMVVTASNDKPLDQIISIAGVEQAQVPLADTLIANGDINSSLKNSAVGRENQSAVNVNDQIEVLNAKVNETNEVKKVNIASKTNDEITENSNATMSEVSEVQFVFSGDCWVNIYDATGERLAWGIKKSGYLMTIAGAAPFTVTLGKPELVAITYQNSTIDMSQFDRGNIAKFNLPLQ